MIHEFALEPSLLCNWGTFQHLISQFGVENGRLISRFPKHWKKLVYDGLGQCGDIERKRLEEALARLDDKLLKQGRDYNSRIGWLNNAEYGHSHQPFRAILAASNPRDHGHVFQPDALDPTLHNDLWRVPRSVTVARTPDGLASVIAPLLRVAWRIIFVDPHFGPENSRYRRPFENFMGEVAACSRENYWPEIQYHLGDNATAEFFQDHCRRLVEVKLPRGSSCRFIRWRRNSLHNRYVLTDRGGVQFGQGLDENAGGGPEFDLVTILDASAAANLFETYYSATTNPDFVDFFDVANLT